MAIALLSFPIALLMSMLLVPILMHFAPNLRLVDRPDGLRKMHMHIMPKSGGLAVGLAVLISILYFFDQFTALIPLLLGSLVILFSGLMDDIFDLNFKWKFFFQMIASFIFLFGTPEIYEKLYFSHSFFSGFATKIVLFTFLMGVSNAINLSDGLDGLAAGITLLSLSIIALFASEAELVAVLIMAMALMGALMGFLRYNTHPAQVFMGDTGSQFIGFTTAALAIYLSQNTASAISPALPLLILGLPILDTLMVMAVRIHAGKSPFSADKNHLHHRLIKFGFRHSHAVLILYCVQMLLMVAAYQLRYQHELIILFFYLVFSTVFLTVLFFTKLENFNFKEKLITQHLNIIKISWLSALTGVFNSSFKVMTFLYACIFMMLNLYCIKFGSVVDYLPLYLLILCFTLMRVFKNNQLLTTRLVAYSSVILLIYNFSVINSSPIIENISNVSFIALAAFFILSIRTMKNNLFRFNNHDVIILCVFFMGSLMSLPASGDAKIEVMLFRFALIIYVVEYLILNSKKSALFIKLSSFYSLFLLSLLAR
jgi:UDP-GlcNAc:undecaprenyl-phosphate GlcNAc-1-phosphate transferase